jgi:hypothetical protein
VIDEPSTLCHCSHCEAVRKELRKALIVMADYPNHELESWLNEQYEKMRKGCIGVRDE